MSKLPAVSSSSSLLPEIIEAILCFLPAKSLGRFKSVSKTWNSLISDPQFIKKHIQRLQTTKLILVSFTNDALYSLDTNQLLPYLLPLNSSHDDDHDILATANELSCVLEHILGSCNGLVLARDANGTIIVINLTTQERWEVSPFAFLKGFGFLTYGFGYDSSTDDYKVVVVMRDVTTANDSINYTYAGVYSLRNNSWKELPNSKHIGFRLRGSLPVVVNENIHWYTNSSTIVSFSFTTEEFNELSLQNLVHDVGGKAWIHNLVDIGGKLGVLFSKGDKYELWVMEDYGVGSCWTPLCVLMLNEHVTAVSLVEGSNRDILLDYGCNVVVFNLDEENYRNVRIKGEPSGFMVLGTYVESLESPARILTAPNLQLIELNQVVKGL